MRRAQQDKHPTSFAPSTEIGSLIEAHRIKLGLSLETVAEYVGDTTPEIIREYEKGDIAIPLHVIYACSNQLNISPALIQKAINRLKK